MSKKSRPGVYVVERIATSASSYDGLRYAVLDGEDGEDGEEGPSYQPVRAFADAKAAEAHRAALDAEFRESFPPPLFCENADEDEGLACDPKALAATLAGFGLTPPKFRGEAYTFPKQFRKWWADHGADLTPAQVAQVWALFPDVGLYRVRKIPLEG